MFRLIQQLGQDLELKVPERTFPVPSVIEDDDGDRLLLVTDRLSMEHYRTAHAMGATAVMVVQTRRIDDINRINGLVLDAATRTFDLSDWGLPFQRWAATVYEICEQGYAPVEPTGPVNDFVHLHTHSEYSPFDGLSTMGEIVAAVQADGQGAVAITDHAYVSGHPDLHKNTDGTGVKPIYGMEGYFVHDIAVRENQHDYWHLVLWAQDDEGLKNLWGLSTASFRDEARYGKPRFDWDMLAAHSSGLLVSTACLGGPLLDPYLKGEEQLALTNFARLGDMFGDRLYIELHANRLEKQMQANHWLVGLSQKSGVPLVAVADSHYAVPADEQYHRAWMAMQTSKDVSEDTELFEGGGYHLLTRAEMVSALDYLPTDVVTQAIANTGKVAERCTAQIRKRSSTPTFSRPTAEHPDPVAHDAERFKDLCRSNWPRKIDSRVPKEAQQPYEDAYAYQTELVVQKQFPGYYLMTADFVGWAKRNKIRVGPGRGSGGASINAWLCDITELDPIQAKLLFSRFMTEGRVSLPDFDIDFPKNKVDLVVDYVISRWGETHVAQVGTQMRIKNKSAFKDVQRAISSRLPGNSFADVVKIAKLIDEAEASTAGLGLSWNDMMAQIGDLLEPYRADYPELFDLAEKFRSRLKGYSRHAAGMIIDPDIDLYDALPMRNGEEGRPMVTQFDLKWVEYLGYVKFDFLSLRNLDTISDALDLIEANTGDVIDLYHWTDEYEDPAVYEELSLGRTMGVFQIETAIGTRTTTLIRPSSREELSAVVALGRPGPMRSGMDKAYIARRDGEEQVVYLDPRLEDILGTTFGIMLYQEDVMAVCQTLAGYGSDEADEVRRILGKKDVGATQQEGVKFVERAIATGTDPRIAQQIWDQMAEFAKYGFNKAHSYAYATLAYWTAWLKTHYPREYLTATMATVDKDRIPQFVAEARRLGYQVLPPDINVSKDGFTAEGLVVRYGLKSVNGIGDAAAEAVTEFQPYASFDDFMARKGPKCNAGHVRILAEIGAFDTLEPNRRALQQRLVDEKTGDATVCTFKDLTLRAVNDLPCGFDWAGEPVVTGRTGKPLKNQPQPPKKCTRACRKYTPKPPVDYATMVAPYTEEDIREIEHRVLGVFLSSSPFDFIDDEVMVETVTADDLFSLPPGSYVVIAIVASARPDPHGRDFGFTTLSTPAGDVSMIVFSKQWEGYRSLLVKGTMVIAQVHKQGPDRYRLISMEVIKETVHATQD